MIKKYITFDDNDNVDKILIEGIHNNIPEDAIEISHEDYDSFFANQPHKTFNKQGQLIDVTIPEPTWDMIKNQRNRLLKETDFTQLLDYQEFSTEEKKLEWKEYRQQLRNIPQTYSNVQDIIWPEKPSE
jgi:hypothetical protein